ncbi:MAG: hypothetical protein KKG04_10500 [Candidatus Thermoplasmatota archaeon]|nr:hypothetical protein [Candidatus Thermoplasmatota archaeon]
MIQILDNKGIGEKNVLRIISSNHTIVFEYDHRLFCISRSLGEDVTILSIPG